MAETKNMRRNMFNCSKFSYFTKKIILTPKKIQKTVEKLHFLE